MLVRAVQHQPDSNDYIMAAFVCVKEAVCVCLRQMLCVKDNPADYCREICCLSWKQQSLCVWHALSLVPLSHSCINTLMHKEHKKVDPIQDGHVWVVRSQCDILFLSASSNSASVCCIFVLVHLSPVSSEPVYQRSIQV